nr:MAG TPA: hypothetical protein [Caudoviricetes sp.]
MVICISYRLCVVSATCSDLSYFHYYSMLFISLL